MAPLTDLEAAFIAIEQSYFDECQAIDNASKYSYARVGIICRDVKNRLLWQHRAKSFHEWVKIACPWSFATAHASLRDVEELADVPEKDLAAIPASNFPIMKQLSTAVRAEPQVLEGAKTKPTEKFVEQIRETHPEQHLDAKKPMRFFPDESAAVKIEEALEMAMRHGAANRSEALELIAYCALEQWQLEDEIEAAAARITDESTQGA